jgi:hypothetical protein
VGDLSPANCADFRGWAERAIASETFFLPIFQNVSSVKHFHLKQFKMFQQELFQLIGHYGEGL